MRKSHQLNNWGDNSDRTTGAGRFFFRSGPPGSRVRKTLLTLFIELLREADNPKFDQKSAVNGYKSLSCTACSLIVALVMTTVSTGTLAMTPRVVACTRDMASTTSIPRITLPKTAYPHPSAVLAW